MVFEFLITWKLFLLSLFAVLQVTDLAREYGALEQASFFSSRSYFIKEDPIQAAREWSGKDTHVIFSGQFPDEKVTVQKLSLSIQPVVLIRKRIERSTPVPKVWP